MYEVRIINGEDTTIINEVDVSFNANRITGEGVEGINTINSFTFFIYPNNSGYELLHELITLVEVENTITEKICFKGRVYKTIPGMEESGLHYKKVICEDEKAFLHDSVQHYAVFQNAVVSDVLTHILEVHNLQVEDHKKIYLGKCEIEVTDGVSIIVSYQDTYDLIMNNIVAEYGGEIILRYEEGRKYLDYLIEMGKHCRTGIRLGKNLQKFEEERDPSDIVTVLYPLGAKVVVVNEEGESQTTDERLTIKSVNNNSPFLIDQTAKAKYGVITRTITFDEIINAGELMDASIRYLEKNNKIICSYILAALDLALIGIDHETIEMGNYYPVIIPTMNVDEELRVIEKRFSIDSPENPTFVIGEKANDIKNIHKEALEIPTIKTEISEIVKGQKEFALQMSKATGMYHSEVKQEDGSTIIYFHDRPTMVKSTRIISVNSEGIGVSPDAGVTWYGFNIDGKFIADQLLANKLTAEHIDVDNLLVGIKIIDSSGDNYWDLKNSVFGMKNGVIHLKGQKVFNAADYTEADRTTCRAIIDGEIELTNEYLAKYDIDCNGVITALDYVRVSNMVSGASTGYTVDTGIEINSGSADGTMFRTQGVSVRPNGLWAKNLSCDNLSIKNPSYEDVTLNLADTTNFSEMTYACRYYPLLGMVFARIRLKANALTANSTYSSVVSVVEEKYKPAAYTALASQGITKMVSARVQSGSMGLVLRTHEAVSSGTYIYLSGFWDVQ